MSLMWKNHSIGAWYCRKIPVFYIDSISEYSACIVVALSKYMFSVYTGQIFCKCVQWTCYIYIECIHCTYSIHVLHAFNVYIAYVQDIHCVNISVYLIYDTKVQFSQQQNKFYSLTQAFALSPTKASSGVWENVHPHNRWYFMENFILYNIFVWFTFNLIWFCFIYSNDVVIPMMLWVLYFILFHSVYSIIPWCYG